jgi:signal transduction histidine kinase
MSSLFAWLATRRAASLALALAVEVTVLVPLGQVPTMPDGVAAAVAAAIAGTVAVVCGPADGVLVAVAGATVFGFADDWGPGELAALVVWPGIVLAAGLFARRIELQRTALRQLMTAQELERQRLALELHDETAQSLVAALITVRRALQADAERLAGNADKSCELIEETIKAIRALAVELRPKALDDFGLVPAVERLAGSVSERTCIHVAVADRGLSAGRLPSKIELALYRTVQDALATVAGWCAQDVRIVLARNGNKAAVVVEAEGCNGAPEPWVGLEALRERIRLLNGRLAVSHDATGRATVRAELPLLERESWHPASTNLGEHFVDFDRLRRFPGAALRAVSHT